MRLIVLEALTIEHFRCFDAEVTIEFPAEGFIFLTGVNLLDKLGSNGCLIGETLIDCPRDLIKYPCGIPIKDLVGSAPFLTYSWDAELDMMILSEVKSVWQTGVQEVFRVELSAYPTRRHNMGRRGGGLNRGRFLPPCELVGTFDHPVMLCDGTWKKLGELEKGDSVKSFYRRDSDRGLIRWSSNVRKEQGSVGWQKNVKNPMVYYGFTHSLSEQQFVCTYVNGTRPKGAHTHHKDENEYNHSPDNLEWKDGYAHLSEHTTKRNLLGLAGWQVSGQHPRGMLGKHHTPETIARIQKTKRLKKQALNHRVISVPKSIGIRPVYDMEVSDTHNFVANGVVVHNSGKSTIFDAIVWCLYGVSIRGERASDLTPWGTKERPHVVLYITIDGESHHTIDRTGSPDTLLINGRPAPQSAVNALMGLSRMRFTNSVIFGQAADLFMDLTVPARGELLSEIMDLSYWDHMTEFAGRRVKDLTGSAAQLKDIISYSTGQLNTLTNQIESLHTAEQEWQSTHDSRVAAAWRVCKEYEASLNAAISAYQTLVEKPMPDLTALSLELDGMRQTSANLRVEHAKAVEAHRHVMHDQSFLRDNKICPTCKQQISQNHVRTQNFLHTQEAERLQLDIDGIKNEWTEYEVAIGQMTEDLQRAQRVVTQQNEALHAARISIDNYQRNLARAKADHMAAQSIVNPFTHQIDTMLTQVDQIQADIDNYTTTEQQVQINLAKATYWRRAFPRVKLFIIRRLLKMFEIETASAAATLGIGDWSITFSSEMETKSGTTRPGINITAVNPRKQGNYKSYSFGEAQRVKLAVSFGLAALVQSLSGVYYNMEALDEPTNWLSPEGIDDLLDSLAMRADTTGKTTWLADQRSINYPFDEIWQATKDNNGTTIARIR